MQEEFQKALDTFPEDTPDIILKIAEKNGLIETDEELSLKISKGEGMNAFNTRKILLFCLDVKLDKIDEKDMASTLQQRLGVNKTIAINVIKELKDNALFETTRKKEEPLPIKKSFSRPQIPRPPRSTSSGDSYREPLV